SRDILNGEEIERLGASGLIRFGSHTASHFRLGGRASPPRLEREIVNSRQRLQDICNQDIALFCYPNGELSEPAMQLVRRNYAGAVTTRLGWHAAKKDPHLVARVGMHDDVSSSPAGFLARLSAWL